MTITAVQIDPPKLHKTIVAHFSLDEIRALCFDLGLDSDELPPGNKSAKTRGLVEMCQRQRRLVALAEAVLEHRPNLAPNEFLRDIANDDAPFKGMLAFEEADEEIFFGREALTAELVARVHGPESNNFLAIVGASGSGKSSVVRAGMIPQLRRQTNWPIHLITPTAHPLQALAASLTRDSESVTATATLMDDLQKEPRALRLFAARMLQNGKATRLLLVIDQFEELFTLCKDEVERTAFVDNLVTAVAEDNQITILLTLRADFYHHCLQYNSLHRLLEQQQKIVPAMSSTELRTAIELPAQQANLTFDDGLVDILLRDVGAADNQTPEPGALPLLSHALLETWQRRDAKENRLTLAGYTEAGGVQGAIAKTAESTYQRLPADQQKIARSIFLRLTELGEGTQDTRRRATLAELLPQNNERTTVEQVLKTLADTRLLTTSDDGAEVAHEALIRQWPTLQSWLDEDREGLRLHRQLTEAAQAWQIAQMDASYLYRGGRLTQTNEWIETTNAQLNELEANFLQASQQFQRDELAEAEARAEREADAAQKLRQRAIFLRGALILAATLAGVALMLAVNANRNATDALNAESTIQAILPTIRSQSDVFAELAATAAADADIAKANAALATTREAEALRAEEIAISALNEVERQRQIALAQSVAALSGMVSEQSNDTELATLLAVEGAHLNWNSDGNVDWLIDNALRSLLMNGFSNKILRGHDHWVNSVAFSPDGRILATGGADQTIRLWNLEEPTVESTILQVGYEINFLVFSPDGTTLASASSDESSIQLWNLTNLSEDPTVLLGDQSDIRALAFSPENNVLASASNNNTIRLWDLADLGSESLVLSGHTSSIVSLAFSPDGGLLVSGGLQELYLWSLDDLEQQPKAISGVDDWVRSVAFSPDGGYMAGADGEIIRVWNANDLDDEPFVLVHGEPGLGVESIAFSPNGETLASVGLFGITLWRLSDLTREPVILQQDKWIRSVAFSPDGNSLAGGGFEDVWLWDLSETGRGVTVLEEHQAAVNSVAFSPDGDILASGGDDSTIRLWNLRSLDGTSNALPAGGEVKGMAFSPDGKTLAGGNTNATIELWDLAELNSSPTTLRGHELTVLSVALVTNDALLASSSTDFTVRLWDLTDPAVPPLILQEASLFPTVAFSPNGDLLASSDFNEIWLWNTNDWTQEPVILSGHKNIINSLAFSPSGAFLASGGDDDTIRLWNLKNQAEIVAMLHGHESGVRSIAFSPDGEMLASAGNDGTVRLWDLNAVEAEPIVLQGHEGWVRSVAFSPDQTLLASGGDDGTIRLWVFLEELVEIGCQKVRRNLSWEEWQRYLPGEPYRQTCPHLPPHPSVPASELQ